MRTTTLIIAMSVHVGPATSSATSGTDLGHFFNPPDAPSPFLDYSMNPTYDPGSLLTVNWTAPFARLSLRVTQMKASDSSTQTLLYNISNSGSFDWTVNTFDWDLSLTRWAAGNVAYFSLQNAVPPYQAIYSAYFNFSTGGKTVVENAQGVTVTVITAPTGGVTAGGDSSGGLAEFEKMAVGFGLGLGLTLLVCVGLIAGLSWRLKQLRNYHETIPIRVSTPSRPGYVLREDDIPFRHVTPPRAISDPCLAADVHPARPKSPGSLRARGFASDRATNAPTLAEPLAGDPAGRPGE